VGPSTELIVLFGALHLIGLALAAFLLVMFVRSETTRSWSPPDDDGGGGGGNDRLRPCRPPGPDPGGLPLPDAVAARVRLRERVRLGDLLPAPQRRPAHPPERVPDRPAEPAGR
jgi:hypothetical protein